MFDLRPVLYVIGLLITILGATMLLPMVVDYLSGGGATEAFFLSSIATMLAGGVIAISCANARGGGLTIKQTFILTTGVWLALPLFAAIPFWIGAPNVSLTDAVFEAMSGLTTTGSTVFSNLEDLPKGTLLWRGLMQWFGGIGIVVVAMVFLPVLRVGGMQIFRSESFDTFGKILPRAAEIAASISRIYVVLTLFCMIGYLLAGMTGFDAVVHAMTTVATGGFANADSSFAETGAASEYVAVLFMLLASLPFVRYVQLAAGSAKPIFKDPQIRAFFLTVFAVAAILTAWNWVMVGAETEEGFRKALFNGVSILTGTGYASADYMLWGGFPVALIFFVGLIGGCAGSTTCAIKIFRLQLLFSAVTAQIKRIHSPHSVVAIRYHGRKVGEDAMSSVISFMVMFVLTLGTLAIALGLVGLDPITSISGAATALANVGPGLGPLIGPSGNFAMLPDPAKWLLTAGMLIGRLELVSIYVLFTLAFWRN